MVHQGLHLLPASCHAFMYCSPQMYMGFRAQGIVEVLRKCPRQFQNFVVLRVKLVVRQP